MISVDLPLVCSRLDALNKRVGNSSWDNSILKRLDLLVEQIKIVEAAVPFFLELKESKELIDNFETSSLILNNATVLLSKSELILSQREKYMSCMASLERVCEMKKVVDKSLIPEYALVFGTANGFSRLKSLEIAIENLSRNVAGQTRSIGNLLMQYESMMTELSRGFVHFDTSLQQMCSKKVHTT